MEGKELQEGSEKVRKSGRDESRLEILKRNTATRIVSETTEQRAACTTGRCETKRSKTN